MDRQQPRGTGRLVAVATAIVVPLALALAQPAAVAQSPSTGTVGSPAPGVSTAPGASGLAVPSPAAIDVAALEWRRAKPSKVFHPANGPMASDLAVGAGGRTLLVGLQMAGGPQKAAVWGSDDGRRWSRLKGSMPEGSQANAIVALDDGFLIAGSDDQGRALLRRSDGQKVTKVDAPAEALPGGALYDLARSPAGGLHAAGMDGATPAVWSSTDGGASWTGTPLAGGSRVVDISVTDTGTVAALGVVPTADGQEQAGVWTSTDGGATWTSTTLPVQGQYVALPDLERTPVGLVAIVVARSDAGGQASAWSSQDGMSWQQVLELPASGSVGTAGDEAIVLGGDTWWHSADGVTWTEVAAPEFAGFAINTSAVRPDGSIVVAGTLYASIGSEVATWIGSPAAP